MPRPHVPPFSLLAPPYEELLPLADAEAFPRNPRALRGAALVWHIDAGCGPQHLETAADRPGGLTLLVILPPAKRVRRMRDEVLAVIEEARPQGVLPYHPIPDAEELQVLLRQGPDEAGLEVLDYLRWRGLRLDQETRRIVRRTVELAPELRTLAALSRGVYLSRRALGRRFHQRGLPVPSHWLQFSRLLHAVVRLQNSESSVGEIAIEFGYPDAFTLSNQMQRLVGVRPSTARERLGWEWFLETWLVTEWQAGGLRMPLKGFVGPSSPIEAWLHRPVAPPARAPWPVNHKRGKRLETSR